MLKIKKKEIQSEKDKQLSDCKKRIKNIQKTHAKIKGLLHQLIIK